MKRLSFFRFWLAAVLAFSFFYGASPTPAPAQAAVKGVFMVNDPGDLPDIAPGDLICNTGIGTCTLRAAIQEANAEPPGSNIIFPPGPVLLIQPAFDLDPLLQINTSIIAPAGNVIIQKLPASNATRGLQILASICFIQGLTIDGFNNGIIVDGPGNIIGVTNAPIQANTIVNSTADGLVLNGPGNVVSGNYIGVLSSAGDLAPNALNGILVNAPSRIGTDGDGLSDDIERNVISANGGYGIRVNGGNDTVIAGNLIGLDSSAALPTGNNTGGIYIGAAAANVRIGTDGNGTSDALERNIISANNGNGITVADAPALTISGNYIGTTANGDGALPNLGSGVDVSGAAATVTVGISSGGSAAQGNLISGNGTNGISITGGQGHVIAGNYIGVNVKGLSALPNGSRGVSVRDSLDMRIGTDGDGLTDELEKNLISANGFYNVAVTGTTTVGTVIAGNWIGLDASGAAALPNPSGTDTGIGILSGAQKTRIGSDNGDKLELNVISGNSAAGIFLLDQSGTVIQGNIIGLSAPSTKGSAKVPNGSGILVAAPDKLPFMSGPALIGTDGDGIYDVEESNLIAGNTGDGIHIEAGAGHTIAGNFIGTDRDSAADLGNGGDGIQLTRSAGTLTVIGTNGDGLSDLLERNIISGNGEFGVYIATDSITVSGNFIGTDQTGATALPNGQGGVLVFNSSYERIGVNSDGSAGETNEGNLISGNNGPGVQLTGGVQSWVSGNRIGTSVNGLTALHNHFGVYVEGTAVGQVIGVWPDGVSDALEGNQISGNEGPGIFVSQTAATQILGNNIGLGSDRLTVVENTNDGIYLQNTQNILIGQNTNGGRNLISGNHFNGIQLSGGNTGARIEGNRIGTNGAGNAHLGNGDNGIRITGSIKPAGGPAVPAPLTLIQNNYIRFNTGDGVLVDQGAGNGHKIIANSFGGNGELAIDLGPDDEVTLNDAGDPDSGANGLQNFPIIQLAYFPSTDTVRISGTLNSTPLTQFDLYFSTANTPDPSGYGEGGGYWPTGSTVTTDSSGNASFDVTLGWTPGVTASWFTAIAVAPDGSTSEFGPALQMQRFFLPAVLR